MVDVKKVWATFYGSSVTLSPLLITSGNVSTFVNRRDSLNISDSSLKTIDDFNTVTTKTLYNDLTSQTRTYTGFTIPFSRTYTIGVTVKLAPIDTNGTTITLPEIRTYLLSTLNLSAYLYRDNTFLVNLGYSTPPINSITSAGNIFGHFVTASDILSLNSGQNSATIEVAYDFYAGDFVCFEFLTSVYRPLNGSLVAYGSSLFMPQIAATLNELTDF